MKAHVKLQNVVSLKTKRTEKDDTPIKTDVLIIAADIKYVDGLHHIVLHFKSSPCIMFPCFGRLLRWNPLYLCAIIHKWP